MPVATGVQTLVLSWSGVLSQLIAGTIDLDDLEGAFFYFGCTRDHAFFPGAHGEPTELYELADDPLDAKEARYKLLAALLITERQDRVTWRPLIGQHTYEQLNKLLVKFGLPPIDASDAKSTGTISLPELHRLVREQELPYCVISAPGMDSTLGD